MGLEEAPAHFESPSQIARVSTEAWAQHVGCPNCGSPTLDRLPNNNPVGDLRCPACFDEYELKSKRGRFGPRVTDGAYSAMRQRLVAKNNPHLMLLSYDGVAREATDIIVIPNYYFVLDLIEPRKPLAPTARRAGWIGCNINISNVPPSGRVALLRNRLWVPREEVRLQWQATRFLRDTSLDARGWLLAVMKVVEALRRTEFTLDEVYASEQTLQKLYPANRNVRPKIRQQLQVLRDNGFIEFLGRGAYRLRSSTHA
ncbi:MAG: restriction endonuclease [Phenylobacterium sp.]|nr:restriction endonuclease [Phenylobacterium sp.]